MTTKPVTLEIISCTTDTSLALPYAESGVRAGFPSPAQDYLEQAIDFNRDMVQHKEATFYARVRGDSMRDEGINDGDLILIDRALEPRDGSLVVAILDGQFTLKRLKMHNGTIELRAANPNFKPMAIGDGQEFSVWGVVKFIIKEA